MDITAFLKLMVEKNGSDLFFTVGAPANMKIEGHTLPISKTPFQSGQVREVAYSLMTDDQIKTFEREMELNMAITMNSIGRFRVNVFRQRGEVAMVIRYIKGYIPSLEELQLPPILSEIIMEVRGLVLVVGATGSGKSTTLASMINYRNLNATGHILTIEDPIEYLYAHEKSIVDQREVGLDTLNYANALKNAMREAPDVILIGEIRDQANMEHAIAYAETGHLCLSTLHANNANQAMDRVINFFDQSAHKQLLQDLSLNLRAIVSLRLIPGEKNKRVPAVEVMLNTPYVSDLIEKGEVDMIKEVMAKSRDQGMQTFDQALFELYKEKQISLENALKNADSKNNLRLKIKLEQEGAINGSDEDFTISQEDYRQH